MTASTGKTGRGVKFEVGDGESPESFVALANVRSINFSGRDAEEIDFTHLDSDGGFRELRQGFKDPGSIAVELQLDPTNASHQDLLAKFLSGEVFGWRINYSAAGWAMAEVGQGYVQNPGDTTIDVDNPIGGTATIRVTGQTAYVAI